MTKPSLRVYRSNDRSELELDRIAGANEPTTVSVPLGKIVPLLLDAANSDRAWLSDFADDLVRIDSDLYDVLLAYQQYRNRAA